MNQTLAEREPLIDSPDSLRQANTEEIGVSRRGLLSGIKTLIPFGKTTETTRTLPNNPFTTNRRGFLRLAAATALSPIAAEAYSRLGGGASFLAPAEVRAAGSFVSIEGGMFYTENGRDGYAVTGVMQEALQQFGGTNTWGNPISRPWFDELGRTSQAFEKGILQVTASAGKDIGVEFYNIFDRLAELGKDSWLETHKQTPPAADWSSDRGKSWPQIVDSHLSILNPYPQIKDYIQSTEEWVNKFGLPVSVKDYGPWVSVRLQRANLQLYKEDVSWARAGDILVANGGSVAKEAGGIIPEEALAFQRLVNGKLVEERPLQASPRYEVKGNISAEILNEVKQNVNKVAEFYKSLGIEPVPGVTVYISDDPEFLTDAEMKTLPWIPASERAALLEQWLNPYRVGGAIADETFRTGAIFIKVNQVGWLSKPPPFRARVIGHEYTAVMKEVRAKLHTGSPMDSIGEGGPRWLHTGTNEEGGFAFVKHIDPQGYKTFEEWGIWAHKNYPYPLRRMETTRGFDGVPEGNGYALSWFAVRYLAQSSGGINSTFRYYEIIGKGKSWQEAFKEAFGRDVETFYTEYEKHIAATYPHHR